MDRFSREHQLYLADWCVLGAVDDVFNRGLYLEACRSDKDMKILGINNRIVYAIGSALLFSLVEIFLAGTPAFIWVYPWWGALPVFITTYIPFFLASYLIYDKAKNAKAFYHHNVRNRRRCACSTYSPRYHIADKKHNYRKAACKRAAFWLVIVS